MKHVSAFARTFWRHLTSMRTALLLLFLLAVASLPGALLPQWHLNAAKTAQYIRDYGAAGRLMDRLGLFDVFGSPWYAAIFLLLGVSLVGCITPRSLELIAQWRAEPSRAPRNLGRLPHHAQVVVEGTPGEVAQRIHDRLRRRGIGGWRAVVRTEPGGARAVSAERGYLREVGNLTFHIAVVGLLITVATGSLLGYTGSNLVTAGEGFCSVAPVSYDNFDPGRLVDGTSMSPFCVTVTDFRATYAANGQAESFRAWLQIQSGDDVATDRWHDIELDVNDPLRIEGQRLYLLGHGYTPTFTVRYPDGEVRDYQAPFQPLDPMFTSEGVIKITDPPDVARSGQLAIAGIFAPSAVFPGGKLSSTYPAPQLPAVAVEIYRGDLGLDSGQPQSIFALDTTQVDSGALVLAERVNLLQGESVTLDDGTEVTFTGAKEFVSLQTSYDPVQGWALLFAILLIGGILASLMIKRRRVWFRVGPADDGSPGLSTVEVGGLARTDQAGYGSEFDQLVALAGEEVTRV